MNNNYNRKNSEQDPFSKADRDFLNKKTDYRDNTTNKNYDGPYNNPASTLQNKPQNQTESKDTLTKKNSFFKFLAVLMALFTLNSFIAGFNIFMNLISALFFGALTYLFWNKAKAITDSTNNDRSSTIKNMSNEQNEEEILKDSETETMRKATKSNGFDHKSRKYRQLKLLKSCGLVLLLDWAHGQKVGTTPPDYLYTVYTLTQLEPKLNQLVNYNYLTIEDDTYYITEQGRKYLQKNRPWLDFHQYTHGKYDILVYHDDWLDYERQYGKIPTFGQIIDE